MSELRWHPLLQEWVITSTERQERTFLPPKDYCPLCPERADGVFTEIPAPTFNIAVFENRFPSLRPQPPEPAVAGSELYPVAPALGECEVVVYTPRHDTSLGEQPVEKIEELIHVWRDRYIDLGGREEIQYVYIFENRGEQIGVTLHHPHGQIYAFPFLPPLVTREQTALAEHRERTGRCLVCDIVAQERGDERRVILQTEHFTAAVPFYARWPYEVHVWASAHRASLAELSGAEISDLALAMKRVITGYDALWGFEMPYVMALKQLPTDGRGPEAEHFRIEFYPPLRTATKMKYLAGVESGTGSFINDTLAEEKAAELRDAILRAAAASA